MKQMRMTGAQLALAAALVAVLAGAIGYGAARFSARPAPATDQSPRKVLYWYDPMKPDQHFDKPGKSPFMDMALLPKYADEPGSGGEVTIDPAARQSLGVRLATAREGSLAQQVTIPGVVGFDERSVAVVQARASGFVERVYGRAPGDVVGAGAPLVDLLIPEWAGAQTEYLAVRRTGDARLVSAARQRLVLLGMPAGTISAVERTGRPQTRFTTSTPLGGAIRVLNVRAGMNVSAGQTLAEINGLSRVWITGSVPQAQAATVVVGRPVGVTLDAYPGETFGGRVTAVLPEAQGDSRTVQIRVEVANPGGRLRPGMFASVSLSAGTARPAVLVPSEAVIRTGRRTLVMVSTGQGRYGPREVTVGREGGGQVEVLSGLSAGEQVVASGQFLIDSEASLAGVTTRLETAPTSHPPAAPALHQGEGRIEQLTAATITLSHGPIPSTGWPAMTMSFRIGDPRLTRGLKVGDRVRFAFDEPADGPTVRRIEKVGQ